MLWPKKVPAERWGGPLVWREPSRWWTVVWRKTCGEWRGKNSALKAAKENNQREEEEAKRVEKEENKEIGLTDEYNLESEFRRAGDGALSSSDVCVFYWGTNELVYWCSSLRYSCPSTSGHLLCCVWSYSHSMSHSSNLQIVKQGAAMSWRLIQGFPWLCPSWHRLQPPLPVTLQWKSLSLVFTEQLDCASVIYLINKVFSKNAIVCIGGGVLNL